ncbi:DUF1516 family protein [Evansella sp. LMS18]|uniref:DUF1516 family protein n=1 Tax=Evansella sp. LMS18 TaxID=2924033 RepID=UPI0020D1C8CB|nr:DUF1516 family protein [Evansella sp. LMS18]UTR11218.1 DUF1516 family protein [Evansella sp. LMS18]
MVHAHNLVWLLMLIVFFLTLFFVKSGKAKPAKITQMTLRLFYILVIVTGGTLLVTYQFYWVAVIKGLLAIWLIYSMEMISTRSAKGTLAGTAKIAYWAQFGIALVIVLFLGWTAI